MTKMEELRDKFIDVISTDMDNASTSRIGIKTKIEALVKLEEVILYREHEETLKRQYDQATGVNQAKGMRPPDVYA